MSNLVELDLSYNKIASLGNNLNTRLGNIKKLNLAGNELDNAEGNDITIICIFHAVLFTSAKLLTRRICLTINSIFSW